MPVPLPQPMYMGRTFLGKRFCLGTSEDYRTRKRNRRRFFFFLVRDCCPIIFLCELFAFCIRICLRCAPLRPPPSLAYCCTLEGNYRNHFNGNIEALAKTIPNRPAAEPNKLLLPNRTLGHLSDTTYVRQRRKRFLSNAQFPVLSPFSIRISVS